MRYDISLTIDYSYERPSDHARCLLHLLPLNIPGLQQVSASLLTIDPVPLQRWDGFDFFGNMATWVVFPDTLSGYRMTLKTQVNRLPPPAQMDLSASLGSLFRDISAVNSLAPDVPHHFMGPSSRVSLDAAMTTFAQEVTSPEMSVLTVVQTVGKALHDHMEFDDSATDVETSPADAFVARRGVCQDFTHIMIACLRGIGVPAGYVSGFLRTVPPPGQKRLEGADAMHAWVRAWCGAEMGWVEYDPTNAIMAGDGHVTIAYGRDYSDISPVRGILRSSGSHDTEHFVDVIPVAEV